MSTVADIIGTKGGKVFTTPDTATDEMVAGLRASLDEEQLVELTTMIAWENFRARFNRGFDVAAQGFSKGASCPIPERRG